MSISQKKRPLFWVATVFVFFILSGLLVGIYFLETQDSKLSASLLGVKIVGLSSDSGSGYTVENGNVYSNNKEVQNLLTRYLVLSQASFYQNTKEDPLFVSVGLDSKQYSSSISYLFEQQDQLVKNLGLKQEIIPKKFLASIVDVKKANDQYLTTPTLSNAEHLLKSYETSQADYDSELSLLLGKVKSAYPASNKKYFVNFGSVADSQTVIGNLELMIKNSQALKSEIDKRRSELSGSLIYGGLKPQIRTFAGDLPKSSKILSPAEVDLGSYDPAAVSGPYLMNSACYGADGSNNYFYILTRKQNGRSLFVTKLATNNYFQKLRSILPADKRFIDQGYLYQHIADGNTYRCNDDEYEARVETIDLFRKQYVSDLLLPKIISASYAKSFKQADMDKLHQDAKAEQQLIEASPVGDKELSAAQTAYYDAYSLLRRYQVSSSTKYSDQDALLQRFQVLSGDGVATSTVFNSSMFMDNLNIRYANGLLTKTDQFADFVYPERSAFSLTYLNYSSAVWRLPAHPSYAYYDTSKINSTDSPYADYFTLLKTYTKDQIMAWYKLNEPAVTSALE